jgi:flagellar biosynthesis/type III secretory pathway protein FliH
MDGLFEIPARGPRAAAPAGVLFAEDFDLPHPEVAPPDAAPPGFTADDLAAAREAAFAEGRGLGLAEAVAQHEAALEAAAGSVAAQLATLRTEARAAADAAAHALAELLLQTLAALFPTLCARHGAAEANAVLAALLPGLGGEPDLILRANPSLLAGLRAELARLDPELAARTECIASEMAAPGDITLRWRHGSATRDAASLWRAVADALAPAGLHLAPLQETAHAR